MKLKTPEIRISSEFYILIFSLLISFCSLAFLPKNLIDATISFLVILSAIILIITIFSFNKTLLKIVSLLILFCSLLAHFIFSQYGIIIDEMTILNSMDNLDNSEAINFIQAIPYFIAFFIAVFLIIKIKIGNYHYKKLFTVIAISSLILGFFIYSNNQQTLKNFFATYSPFNTISGLAQYSGRIQKIRHSKLEDLNKIYNFKNHNSEKINVILVLGESARSDHFSLNGYTRNTNPLLQKINKKNLIFFKDVTPCYNSTSYSVSCILSHQNRQDFDVSENEYSNIISIYKNLNFKTNWLSTQSAFGTGNFILKNAIQAENLKMKSSYRNEAYKHDNRMLDEFLIKDMKVVLDNNNNNFIILHTNGSHFPLNAFIHDEFIKFKPACDKLSPQECSREELNNAYDNTILYTDFFLFNLIKTLENTNSIMIYVSDHGSFLGENGKYYHGNKEDYDDPEHRVPMLLWISDSLLKKDHYRLAFSNAAKKINNSLSHDEVFYSLLGCSHISHDIKGMEKLNICANTR